MYRLCYHKSLLLTVLHSHALGMKTLSPNLAKELRIVMKYVNYMRISSLRHFIFNELCNKIIWSTSMPFELSVAMLRKCSKSCFRLLCVELVLIFRRALILSHRTIIITINKWRATESTSSKRNKTWRLFKKCFSYESDKQRMKTSQTFSCLTTL